LYVSLLCVVTGAAICQGVKLTILQNDVPFKNHGVIVYSDDVNVIESVVYEVCQ